VPAVVVKDELATGLLVERHRISQIKETFYAITPSRRFPNKLVQELVRKQKANLPEPPPKTTSTKKP
jgi:LysR family transcriptional activator of nhaA